MLDAYAIKDFGSLKIAFVGVCTPQTITSSTPAYFQDENGELIYGFQQDDTGEALYASVQKAVDDARAIKDARDAYDKLTDDQKKLVPDEILKKLTDAESTYKDLTAPRPRPSDKTNTKTDGKGVKSQNTGDNSQMTLWLSGVLLSAAALLLLAKKRRQDA